MSYEISFSITALCPCCGKELPSSAYLTESKPTGHPLDRDNPYERKDRRVFITPCADCFEHKPKADVSGAGGLDLTQRCARTPAGGWPLATTCQRCKGQHAQCDRGRTDGMPASAAGWVEAGLVCQACAGDAPRGKCLNPKCVGGPIVRELVPADAAGVAAAHPQQCNCAECQEMATRLMREAAAASGVAMGGEGQQ